MFTCILNRGIRKSRLRAGPNIPASRFICAAVVEVAKDVLIVVSSIEVIVDAGNHDWI